MGNLKGIRKPFRLTKRKTILLIGAGVVVVLLVVLWFSAANAWQLQASQTDGELKSTLKARETALTSKNKQQRLAAVDTLARTEQPADHCKGDWWYAWQQNVSEPSRTAKERCEASYASSEAIYNAATGLKNYMNDEDMVRQQINSLKIDQKQKDWQAKAVESASKAQGALKDLKVSNAAKPVHDEAVKRIDSIQKAWALLIEADRKQDKGAYQTAIASLNDVYAQLGAVTDVSDVQIRILVEELRTT